VLVYYLFSTRHDLKKDLETNLCGITCSTKLRYAFGSGPNFMVNARFAMILFSRNFDKAPQSVDDVIDD
jgi:hypothetical protein